MLWGFDQTQALAVAVVPTPCPWRPHRQSLPKREGRPPWPRAEGNTVQPLRRLQPLQADELA